MFVKDASRYEGADYRPPLARLCAAGVYRALASQRLIIMMFILLLIIFDTHVLTITDWDMTTCLFVLLLVGC